MNSKKIILLILLLSLVGLADSAYLTLEHFGKIFVPCGVSFLVDCGRVLKSKYSEILGVPLALLGVFHYGLFSFVNLLNLVKRGFYFRLAAVLISAIGAVSSLVFVFIQLFVIGSICFYCMLSALVSFTLVYLIFKNFAKETKFFVTKLSGFLYRLFLKRILFTLDAEFIHETTLNLGKILAKVKPVRKIFTFFYHFEDDFLKQKVLGINFPNPIGLAAGFDYKALLYDFLPTLSFGFMTIGTVTNLPYGGNPPPRLGRLPKSRSLLVNKGFKNEGAKKISEKLKNVNFEIPVGISIGRTNSKKLDTQEKSIKDIISAFKIFETSRIKNSYYELNISCPNLINQKRIVFDEPAQLQKLLEAIDKLKIKKPIFVKMPIDKSDKETLKLLGVIAKHSPKGVIFGNLQKDKSYPGLFPNEVAKFKNGYFSGKPTFERSNELIKLAYKNFKGRFIIVGCGGVFNAEDAYTKIKLGATLVELITGLVYEGPQLVTEINLKLVDLVKKDGYKNVSEAIGVDVE